MKEVKKPDISIISFFVMLFYVLFYTVPAFGFDTAWRAAVAGAVCIAVLFLCECLFGLIKKRFSANVGAFIATAAVGAAFAAEYIRTAPGGLTVSSGPYGWEQSLARIAFLPPIAVTLAVNIGDIVNKLIHPQADKPDDREP